MLPFKDRVPEEVRSNVIYKFTCESCQASYVGSTQQRFKARVDQHRGFSSRTENPLATRMHSVPRNHCEESNHPLKATNFKIIDSLSHNRNLQTLESLHIDNIKPPLNIQQTASPLLVTH